MCCFSSMKQDLKKNVCYVNTHDCGSTNDYFKKKLGRKVINNKKQNKNKTETFFYNFPFYNLHNKHY